MKSEGQNNSEFVENHVNIRNHAPSFQRCMLGRYSQPHPSDWLPAAVRGAQSHVFIFLPTVWRSDASDFNAVQT
jgi:hypothetical protein